MLQKLSLLALLLLASTLSLFSQNSFDENSFLRLQNFSTGANSVHLAYGDLDGDGKSDIAVANFGSNTISVFRNISGSFIELASKVDIVTSDKPYSISIADLNKDGKPEIIAPLPGFVAVYKNISTSGNLAFEAEQLTSTPVYATSITTSDIDNDTYPDIAVVNNQANTVSIYSNTNRDGGISLQLSTTIRTLAPAMDVIFANINAGTKPEMIVTNYYSSSISVFINESTSGNITFGERVDFPAETQPNTIRAGDLDGDGKQDLVIGNANIWTLSVLMNRGNGDTVDFAPKQSFEAGQTQYGIAIADFDNDGKNDIATGNYSVNTMSVLKNNTQPGSDTVSFKPAYTYENMNSAPYDLLAADINNDGYKDLITANFPTQASITVWYNNLAKAAPPVPAVESFSPLAGPIGTTVTINGVGFSNTAAENRVFFGSIEANVLTAKSTQLTVQVPAGAGFGLISVVVNGFVGYSAYPFNVTFPGGGGTEVVFNVDFLAQQWNLPANNPRTIKFADLDGDNRPDVVFTQQAGNKLSIYRNTSTEGLISYGPNIDLPTGTDPFDITINDFNGDGKPDIAITNMNAGLASTVMVYKNNSTTGNISFTKVLTMDAGSGAIGIISSDFDFDGKIDLSISAGNAGLFYYLKNISGGGKIEFELMEEVPNWNHSSRMIEGDIDGDGIADVITVNFSSQSVTVNINEGTSASPIFSSATDISVGQFPSDVAIGDVDGDGKQDLLVANYGSNTISVLRNISSPGAPAFESALIETGKDAISVSLGDLDGDGKLEMIVASGQPGKIGIYKNLSVSGKIEFGEVAYFQTGEGPTDVACADIDGDGKIDVAVGNGYSSVTILRNVFGEPKVTPSGSNAVYGAIVQKSYYDSTVNDYRGQPYVQRHYEVTPVNNPNSATGTITLYFRQSDFDAFNEHPDRGLSLPMGPNDSSGIANLRVYQYHGTSTEGTPGTYSGSSVVIDPDDSRIVWNAETQWWEVSFEVSGFSGFFVSVTGDGMNPPPPVSENKITVYPNPAYGRVVVKHPVSENAIIKIVDMRGSVVRIASLKNDASQTEIGIYGLAPGIYKIIWQTVNAKYVKTLMVK